MLGLLLAAALAVSGPAAPAAEAAPQPLELKIEAGYNGQIKEAAWFPATFTLTNPGDDLSGELVVQTASPNGGRDVAFVRKVDLPKGGTKEVRMTLPGRYYNKGSNTVTFYEGSAGQGARVPWATAENYVTVSAVNPPQTLFVGVAARDPDTAAFLSLLSQRGGVPVQLVPLTPAGLPEESMMLDTLDAVILNDIAGDTLTAEQTAALKAWVGRGGSLFLAGGAGYPRTAAALADIAPVTVQGTETVTTLPALAQLAGRPLGLSQGLTVSRAQLKPGAQAVAEEQGIPLLAKADYGSGEIWYAAYDLAMEPLAGWNGNAPLWQRLLAKQLPSGGPGGNPKWMTGSQDYWQLNSALDSFPALQPPALGLLALVFAGYVIFVAPVLYLILSRLDRREWAWVAVPLISVLFTIGIYGIGAAGRNDTLSQTLSILEVGEGGHGIRTSGTSVFVPDGGTYRLEFAGDAFVTPSFGYSGGRQNLDGSVEAYIVQDAGSREVRFQDVPYWSVRKAMLHSEPVADTGQFEIAMQSDSGGLRGQLVNRTAETLRDVYLVMGGQTQELGELKPGESREFQWSSGYRGAWGMDLAQLVFPYSGSRDEKQRERALLQTYLQSRGAVDATDRPVVVGFSEAERSLYRVNGKPVESDVLQMWVQPVRISFEQNGQVHIPAGYVTPSMLSHNMQSLGIRNNDALELSAGELSFEYVPNVAGAEFSRLVIHTEPSPDLELQIWNEAKAEWSALDSQPTIELTGDEALSVSSGGFVRMKVVANGGYAAFRYPQIQWEGEIRR